MIFFNQFIVDCVKLIRLTKKIPVVFVDINILNSFAIYKRNTSVSSNSARRKCAASMAMISSIKVFIEIF